MQGSAPSTPLRHHVAFLNNFRRIRSLGDPPQSPAVTALPEDAPEGACRAQPPKAALSAELSQGRLRRQCPLGTIAGVGAIFWNGTQTVPYEDFI